MTTTQEIIAVLEKYNHHKTAVALEKTKDAKEIWNALRTDVYDALPDYVSGKDRDGIERIEDGFRFFCTFAMREFRDVDSLELVNKEGKLLKRLAKYLQTKLGFKLSDSIMGIIGDKLQYLLNKVNSAYTLDTSDIIDWEDGQFGKSGSCWWGQYKDSQDVFIDNGGWAVRFYDGMDDTRGIGRTWILPRDNMLVCFNSYGVERPTTSKAIKQLFHRHDITLHYKVVEVVNSQNSEIPYINGGTGFILYPEGMESSDIPDEYDVDMEYDDNKCICDMCGDRFDEDSGCPIGDEWYCDDCVRSNFTQCDCCNEYFRDSYHDVHSVVHSDSRYFNLCESCASRRGYAMCKDCEKYSDDYIVTEDTSECYCDECKDNHAYYCEECNEWNSEEHNHEEESEEEESNDSRFFSITTSIENPNVMGKKINRDSPVKVYRVNGEVGLCLYRESDLFDVSKKWYAISHDISGLAVKKDIDNKQKAKELLIALYNLGNWNRTNEELQDDRPFLDLAVSTIKSIMEG